MCFFGTSQVSRRLLSQDPVATDAKKIKMGIGHYRMEVKSATDATLRAGQCR